MAVKNKKEKEMDFYFTEKIKWSDVNPLNHAIRNEYVSNLLNLSYAVCNNLIKKNLSVTSGFVCGKLVADVNKDEELREHIKQGRCVGFTYDGYSIDEFVKTAKELKKVGLGFYLTATGFYAVLGLNDIKWRSGTNWVLVE